MGILMHVYVFPLVTREQLNVGADPSLSDVPRRMMSRTNMQKTSERID